MTHLLKVAVAVALIILYGRLGALIDVSVHAYLEKVGAKKRIDSSALCRVPHSSIKVLSLRLPSYIPREPMGSYLLRSLSPPPTYPLPPLLSSSQHEIMVCRL